MHAHENAWAEENSVENRGRQNSSFCWLKSKGSTSSFHLPLGVCVCVFESLSCVRLCDRMNCSPQAPLSMGLSRQEYWSGLPCPSPGDLPDPGIKPRSPALQADSLPFEPPGKPPRSTWVGVFVPSDRALLKPSFLMSHCRRNSGRDKVIGKKWIYLERDTYISWASLMAQW